MQWNYLKWKPYTVYFVWQLTTHWPVKEHRLGLRADKSALVAQRNDGLLWSREAGERPSGGGKLGKLYVSKVEEVEGKPVFKFCETARAKEKGRDILASRK